jgi:hypothetical protein
MGKTQEPPALSKTGKSLPDVNLQDLIRQQGIKPFDVEKFSALWPEEFDPDEFAKWRQAFKAEQLGRASGKPST